MIDKLVVRIEIFLKSKSYETIFSYFAEFWFGIISTIISFSRNCILIYSFVIYNYSLINNYKFSAKLLHLIPSNDYSINNY